VRYLLIAVLAGAAMPAAADSLFTQSAEDGGTIISEPTERFTVGDIITVLVRESITASTVADTRTRKESDVESKAPAGSNEFLVGDSPDYRGGIFSPGELPNWKVEAENEHRGQGRTRRTSELVTTITCHVAEVLENGNLVLEGEKVLTVNREDTTLVIRGMVRPEDVSRANTVPSSLMYASNLELRGKGPLWNNQRRGLFTKILDWFSPF